ncbi:MAG: hypothetical protein GX913_00475 [Clostridiales bacterium]|nr:hypothetical protein [Clostridiales bacterium]
MKWYAPIIEELCGSIEADSYTACLCHDLGRVVKRKEYLVLMIKKS